MNLNSRSSLIARLRKGKQKRSQFVDSHLTKGIAYQIRATRDRLGWSQERLATEVGMPQNAISRLESPDYGKPTLTTLKRIASAFDVGLVVRFVPFSEIIDWVSGTPRIDLGLSSISLGVSDFDDEERHGVFDERPPRDQKTALVQHGALSGEEYRLYCQPSGIVQGIAFPGDIPKISVQSATSYQHADSPTLKERAN